MKKSLTVIFTQSFLPGGGGVEVSADQIAREVQVRGISDVVVATFSRGKKVAEQVFDAAYALTVIRKAPFFYNAIIPLNRYFNSIIGGGNTLGVRGFLAMVIVGCVGILDVGLLGFTSLFRYRKETKLVVCFGLLPLFIASLFRVLPFFHYRVVFNNGFIYRRSGNGLIDKVITILLRSVDHTFCISQSSATALCQEFAIDEQRVTAYCAWMGEAIIPPITKVSSYDNRVTKLLFVGRIVPEKGIRQLVELAEYIHSIDLTDSYVITVVGDSSHPIQDELLVAAKKYQCLRYVGRVNKPELWEYYCDAEIFLMPSSGEEGAGNVILEACRFGLPVIGSNKGGAPEIITQFPFSRVLDSFQSDELMTVINDVKNKIAANGREEIIKQYYQLLRDRYSEKNFANHEKVICKFFGE